MVPDHVCRSATALLVLFIGLPENLRAADPTLAPGVIARLRMKEPEHYRCINCLAFAPDGKTIAVGSTSGLYLWKPGAKGPARSLSPPDKESVWNTLALRFVASGKRLEGAGHGWLCRWDVATGRELGSRELGSVAFGILTSHVAVARNTRTLVIASYGTSVHLLNPETGKQQHRWVAHESLVDGIALSDDGRLLASTSLGGNLRLWNPETGKEHLRLAGAEGADDSSPSAQPCLSPDCRLVAGGLPGRWLCIWDTTSGQPVRQIRVTKTFLRSAFSPDGRVIAVGGKGRIQLFEVASGKERLRLPAGKHTVWCLAFSPDGKRLAVGDSDATVWLYDLHTR